MGMDIYGKDPNDEAGKYFYLNVWYWHPLWQYVEDSFPKLAKKLEKGHHNDGYGLDQSQSLNLATQLETEISNGNALRYIVARPPLLPTIKQQEESPWWVVTVTQMIVAAMAAGLSLSQASEEDASKSIEYLATRQFEFDIPTLKDFVNFLKHCGGFEIW